MAKVTMPTSPTRVNDWSTIAVDTHVHLYPCADPDIALSAGRDNLADAAQSAGYSPDCFALLLTESTGHDAFSSLAAGRLVPRDWNVKEVVGDQAALTATRNRDGAEILIVAGCQIQTAEGIEVLGIATSERFEDGKSIRETLTELDAVGTPSVLPWGLGKWVGKRGQEVNALLSEPRYKGFKLGDNAGRPLGWRTPKVFREGASNAIPFLPGSDTLPFPSAESGIGRYGCILECPVSPEKPAKDLREFIFALGEQPALIGARRALPAVISEQISMRRHKKSSQENAPREVAL